MRLEILLLGRSAQLHEYEIGAEKESVAYKCMRVKCYAVMKKAKGQLEAWHRSIAYPLQHSLCLIYGAV